MRGEWQVRSGAAPPVAARQFGREGLARGDDRIGNTLNFNNPVPPGHTLNIGAGVSNRPGWT